MFRKSLLNVTLSDSEELNQSIELRNNTISFINISLSSLNDSVDKFLNAEDIIQSDVIIESRCDPGYMNYI